MSELVTSHVILKVLAGSRAYGLAKPTSDYDYHGVYAVPTEEFFRLESQVKNSEWTESAEKDCQTWEVGHFLHLAIHCNPTVLETFVAPVVSTTRHGAQLRELFPFVLNRRRVYDAFRGYASNQRAKLFTKPEDPTTNQVGDRKWKFATQYLRVLMTGARLLLSGELVLDMHAYGIAGSTAPYLADVRAGKLTIGQVLDRAELLEDQLRDAYDQSQLREEADFNRLNQWLLGVRYERW